MKNKGGAPLGNKNASLANRQGFAKGAYTNALIKAEKRINRIRKTDPTYGLIPENRMKEKKKLTLIDGIAEDHWLAAESGDARERESLVDRMEGKVVSKTEINTEISGKVTHEGFRVTFEPPKMLDVAGEVLEHGGG